MDKWVVEVTVSPATVGAEGLRRQVWGTIGESIGRDMGEILGTGMDALILTLEAVFAPQKTIGLHAVLLFNQPFIAHFV